MNGFFWPNRILILSGSQSPGAVAVPERRKRVATAFSPITNPASANEAKARHVALQRSSERSGYSFFSAHLGMTRTLVSMMISPAFSMIVLISPEYAMASGLITYKLVSNHHPISLVVISGRKSLDLTSINIQIFFPSVNHL